MAKVRLDQALVQKGLVASRSQAENYIHLGKIRINGQIAKKAGVPVDLNAKLEVIGGQYVSRAAYKLASVADTLKLDFKDKTVLDVDSSTGGFSDFALKHNAKKVIAVDVGSGQIHPSLKQNPRLEIHEKTDIRQFKTNQQLDIVLIDVSFISLRGVLPKVSKFVGQKSLVIAMAKPQFETGKSTQKHKGIIKNNRERRAILKDLESWIQKLFIIVKKADSEVAGSKGNVERFYLLKKLKVNG